MAECEAQVVKRFEWPPVRNVLFINAVLLPLHRKPPFAHWGAMAALWIDGGHLGPESNILQARGTFHSVLLGPPSSWHTHTHAHAHTRARTHRNNGLSVLASIRPPSSVNSFVARAQCTCKCSSNAATFNLTDPALCLPPTEGFDCRCGNLFCAIHRYSDKHDCPYDYRGAAAARIRKENPIVVAEKIQKLWGGTRVCPSSSSWPAWIWNNVDTDGGKKNDPDLQMASLVSW